MVHGSTTPLHLSSGRYRCYSDAMTTNSVTQPFVFIGGDPSLDLVNTVAWTRAGPVHERLTSYEALTRWTEGAGLLDRAAGASLRRIAQSRVHEARTVLAQTRAMRAVLRQLFSAKPGSKTAAESLAAYNGSLREALQWVEIRLATGRRTRAGHAFLQWSWQGLEDSLESPLRLIVWSAAELLVSDEAAEIRTCAGEDCGWVYVDRSRNGLRRWCRMQTCGTKSKSRRRRERSAH